MRRHFAPLGGARRLIITAVGMTPHLAIMVVAVLVAVITMLVAAGPLARFVEGNPTIIMLALGFLLMIGMTLIAGRADKGGSWSPLVSLAPIKKRTGVETKCLTVLVRHPWWRAGYCDVAAFWMRPRCCTLPSYDENTKADVDEAVQGCRARICR